MNFPDSFYKYFQTPEQVFFYYSTHYCQPSYPTHIMYHQNQNLLPQTIQKQPQIFEPFPSIKREESPEGGTDQAPQMDEVITPIKVQTKVQQSYHLNQRQHQPTTRVMDKRREELSLMDKSRKQKYFKKNTQSNLINNVFSYICSESKSHRMVQQLIGDHPQKIQIFYIFANNFKRLNGKYINRKNIKAICEIVPKQPHFKMLSKSIKRLMTLPMRELRLFLRKLIFNYLRGPQSIIPLLTSKKICKIGLEEHLKRRRELSRFLQTMLQDYN